MAKIRDIVGNILEEFTRAQHSANLYAAQLGREYAQNDMLRYFSIPNAAAGELDFELRFAVKQSDQIEEISEVNYPRLMQFFQQLSISIAETAITTAIYTADHFVIRDAAGYRRLKEKEQKLRGDFRDFLARKLKEAFVAKGSNEIDKDGCLYHPRITEIAMEVIEKEFFLHRELKLNAGSSGELREKVREACGSFVETLVEHSCRDMNMMETRHEEALNVILDSETLSEITPENIQKVRFKVNLRNYRISQIEQDGESKECIIPAEG